MSFVLNVRRKLIQLEQLKENIHENMVYVCYDIHLEPRDP